jgi:transcriptional regulator with XRE-family HTH domain
VIVGEELRKARLAAGLTQEKLAFECGLDRTYISMLENGKKIPTLTALFKICKATDIRPSTVVARIEKRGWVAK